MSRRVTLTKAQEDRYLREVRRIEKKFYALFEHVDVSLPTPLNGKEERRRFFMHYSDDERYNPQIVFEDRHIDERSIEQLRNFTIDTSYDPYGFKRILEKKRKEKIEELLCYYYWGTQQSSVYSVLYRGRPSAGLVRQAKRFCKRYRRQVVRFKRYTPKRLGSELRAEVKRLTGEKVTIRYRELANKVNINTKSMVVTINPNEEFTSLDLERLKIHEIGTHYMRAYNGRQFGLRLLEEGTRNYIQTEEGLAAYMEELGGVLSQAQLYIYAGRTIATYYALKKSFYEVFMILKEYGFKDSDAYTITLRAKRNLCDTSQPGGFTKDYAYFKGYHMVKDFARYHDIRDLFIGKITLDDRKYIAPFIKQYRDQVRTIFEDE